MSSGKRRSSRTGSRRERSRPEPRVAVQRSRFGTELVIDGTFASLRREGQASTGSVWDAIAAPVLALAPERRRRFLILGLAAGSVARLLRALLPDCQIVGVEIDAEVLAVARAHFDLDALGVEVVCADALAVLQRERRRFDAIFDDVFVGRGDAVHKPAWLPEPGHRLARQRLRSGGLLVSNTLDEAPFVARVLLEQYARVLELRVDDYDNRIFAAGPDGLDARRLRRALAATPLLAPGLPALRLRTLRRRGGAG